MTNAPENIWTTGNKKTGSWNNTAISLRIAPEQTKYTRTDIANARIAELEAALLECQEEIDDYIRQEYPSKNYPHERYRQRDFAANPARIALGTPNPKTGAK
jgi:hypothetical protein